LARQRPFATFGVMSTSQRVETIPFFGKFDFRRAFAFGAAPGAVMITIAVGVATDPEASKAMSSYMPRIGGTSETVPQVPAQPFIAEAAETKVEVAQPR
jgi:hypothetical protein